MYKGRAIFLVLVPLFPVIYSCLAPPKRGGDHHGSSSVPTNYFTTPTVPEEQTTSLFDKLSCLVEPKCDNTDDSGEPCPSNHSCILVTIDDYACCLDPVQEKCEMECMEKRSIEYRTPTGVYTNQECNDKALDGASNIPFRALLPVKYSDGIGVPLGANISELYNNFPLPSARDVVIEFTQFTFENSTKHTPMIMQWGQWLDHDVTGSKSQICSFECNDCEYKEPCFPIIIKPGDTIESTSDLEGCLPFVRFLPVCGTGKDALSPRRYLNSITAFVDGSQVYGDDEATVRKLRDFTTDLGLLKVGIPSKTGKSMLPFPSDDSDLATLPTNCPTGDLNCFVSPDARTNIVFGLIVMHTLFLREHNRLVERLHEINPQWDGEKLYQEGRKIVGAINQIISYNEYLPELLGGDAISAYSGAVNTTENPDVTNAFVGAAFRLHNMIAPTVYRLDESFQQMPESAGNILMSENFFAPTRLLDEGGIDPVIRGLYAVPNKNVTPSTVTVVDFSSHFTIDVPTLNIHRGRDFGLQPYNEWRKFSKLSKLTNFENDEDNVVNKDILKKLNDLYGHPDNVDLWIGGVVENIQNDGLVGPTFSRILIENFERIRNTDRFWYENPSVFSPEQLMELRNVTLARILCDNGDDIKRVPRKIFRLEDAMNFESCESIPKMNLEAWTE